METQAQIFVSEMAYDLVGSEILRIAGEVNKLKAAGNEVVNYTVGDYNPREFPIPAELTERIIQFYREGQTNYPPAMGMPELREAIADLYRRELGVDYQLGEVQIGAGCRPLIYCAFATLLDAGDRVIYGTPSWNTNHYCHIVGAVPVELITSPENNFLPTAEQIAPHLHEANLLALCSPANPTGTTFDAGQLTEICKLVLAENEHRKLRGSKPLYILYDQIYWKLTAHGVQHVHPVVIEPKLKDYVIYVDGASKAYAGTGIRVGWMLGPQHLIDKMSNILAHMGAWAPKPEQLALASYIALREPQQVFLEALKHKVFGRLEKIYASILEMNKAELPISALAPQGGIYLAVQIHIIGRKTVDGKVLGTADDIFYYILQEAGVAIVPFYAFGAKNRDDWFRLSVGAVTESELERSLVNLRAALTRLQPRF